MFYNKRKYRARARAFFATRGSTNANLLGGRERGITNSNGRLLVDSPPAAFAQVEYGFIDDGDYSNVEDVADVHGTLAHRVAFGRRASQDLSQRRLENGEEEREEEQSLVWDLPEGESNGWSLSGRREAGSDRHHRSHSFSTEEEEGEEVVLSWC